MLSGGSRSALRLPWPAPAAARSRPLWLAEALDGHGDGDAEPLRDWTPADVCIVGGGFTGLWTALEVLAAEPAARVVVLEADVCGGGASGANGGFALSWWPKIESLIGRVGEDAAYDWARRSADAVTELGTFCEEHGIDAQFRRGGWLWTATSAAQVGAWSGAVRLAGRRGDAPFVELSPEEVQARSGSAQHLAGVLEPGCAVVHPGRLVRGLRRVALERGAVLHERTPAVSVDARDGTVLTPSGGVRAGKVLLAANAWAARVPGLRRSLVAISSDVVATAPMPDVLERIGWTGGEAISDSRLMVHYYRTTGDGRIVFGKGGGALAFAGRISTGFEYSRPRAQTAAQRLWELYPEARGVPITHAWSGAVDRSRDGLPIVGSLDPARRVWYAAGLSGNGVAPALLLGRVLASSALGRQDAWGSCPLIAPPGTFAPEPARYLGGLAVKRAVRRKERLEDRGASVDALTRRVAALAPSGFFKADDPSDTEIARTVR